MTTERQYPKSAVLLFPILSLGTFFPLSIESLPSVLDAGYSLRITTGRRGISLALEHMRIRPGEKVLIPSYHCNSMVEPVIHASAVPVFYKVKDDGAVDIEDINARIDSDTRALMVTHYFGFPEKMADIRRFCDAKNLILIEDCVHVFLAKRTASPLVPMAAMQSPAP